jgi:hypothetical protein
MGLLDDAEHRLHADQAAQAAREARRVAAQAEDEREGAALWQDFLRRAEAAAIDPDRKIHERDYVAWWYYTSTYLLRGERVLSTSMTPHRRERVSTTVLAEAFTLDVPAYDPLLITLDGKVVTLKQYAIQDPFPPVTPGEAEGRWRETAEFRPLRASEHLAPRNSDLTPWGLPIAEAMIHRLRG